MLINQSEYLSMLSDIRNDIRCSQHKAMLSANQTMIAHYWRIGQTINAHKAWGNKFIDVLSNDIRQDFPQRRVRIGHRIIIFCAESEIHGKAGRNIFV